MLLERTIFQLDIGHVPPDQAQEMGRFGYMQWLGALPGDANYLAEAMRAYAAAQPFIRSSPAVAVFCDLLVASAEMPPTPLPLPMADRYRRGGAQGRRLSL
ncbi:MAG: hypothetical protein AAGF30_16865 [Pseudomonadota bacterium]